MTKISKITPQEVVSHQDVSKFEGIELRPDDIIINFHSLNWGMKDKNPLDSITFFKSDNDYSKLAIFLRC